MWFARAVHLDCSHRLGLEAHVTTARGKTWYRSPALVPRRVRPPTPDRGGDLLDLGTPSSESASRRATSLTPVVDLDQWVRVDDLLRCSSMVEGGEGWLQRFLHGWMLAPRSWRVITGLSPKRARPSMSRMAERAVSYGGPVGGSGHVALSQLLIERAMMTDEFPKLWAWLRPVWCGDSAGFFQMSARASGPE